MILKIFLIGFYRIFIDFKENLLIFFIEFFFRFLEDFKKRF
jgi:hypothetical protein